MAPKIHAEDVNDVMSFFDEMANPTILCNFLKSELDLSTKIVNLEERASNLENDFSSICSAARELALSVKRYVDRVETEKKSWDILECILSDNCNARDILDHVKIFFNFVLAKMATKHAEITDIKMLWHLVDSEGVKQVFHDVIKTFGFKDTDADDIKVLLAVIYKLHVDMEHEATTDDKATAEHDISFKLSGEELQHLVEEVDRKLRNLSTKVPESLSADTNRCSSAQECSSDEEEHALDTVDYKYSKRHDNILKAVGSLNLYVNLKNVARKIVGIVVYALNIGRQDKTLSIIHTEKNTA